MDLTINAGAYTGIFELGGLSLTNLTIKDGASNVKLSFSQANPSEMTIFRYETGASNVKLSGLANANFSTMIFDSGAGDYTLDFSGSLKRDATITISSGLSNIILVIPQNVNANVTTESGLANINAGPGWNSKRQSIHSKRFRADANFPDQNRRRESDANSLIPRNSIFPLQLERKNLLNRSKRS